MFSLRALFILVGFVAVAVAALVNRTPLWESAIVTLTVGLAVGATIAVWLSPAGRTFYAPFAGVLWLYLLILFYPPLNDLERKLFTNSLIFRWWTAIAAEERTPGIPDDLMGAYWHIYLYEVANRAPQPGMTSFRILTTLTAFYNTVHCVAATLLGALAGFLGVLVTRRRAKVVSEKKEAFPAGVADDRAGSK